MFIAAWSLPYFMYYTEIINRLLFEYETLSQEEIAETSKSLPRKLIRWLGAHHPDNKTRKIFYQITHIEIGEDSVINLNFIVSDGYAPLLVIGKRVSIAPNVTIICESAPNNSLINNNVYVKENLITEKKVILSDDCWIGANVTILPGVTIGAKAIVGAGAVVNRDVPDNVIVAGVPATFIRRIE